MAGEFAGHAADSTSKAIYDNPSLVAPADRLYGDDADDDGKPDVYDPSDEQWADQPGAAARAAGYPRA